MRPQTVWKGGTDMQIYIDSADLGKIRRADRMGVVSGITTNPVILAREEGNAAEIIRRLTENFPDYPVFAQVTGTEAQKMVEEALLYMDVSSSVIVKIPACEQELAAVRILKDMQKTGKRSVQICATTVLSAAQAVLCAAAGADYVAPYVGDIDETGYSGMNTLKDIVQALAGTGTKVLAAAANRAQDIVEAARAGADILTVSPEGIFHVFEKTYPLTEQYLKLFAEAGQTKQTERGIDAPRFRHTGYIVKDIQKASEAFSSCFPMMDPWKFCTTRMSSEEVLDGRACHLIIGVSRIGGHAVELIQAMADCPDCYHMEAREGINHIAFVYPDDVFDQVKETLLSHGYAVAFAAHQKKSGEKCYYFRHESQPILIELNNMELEDPEFASLGEALEHD